MALINTNTEKEFEEKVKQSKKVVLVDFWADWCPPCVAMAPILHDIAESMDLQLDVVKVDIEASFDNRQLAMDHGVQGIPNMLVYKGGEVVDQLIGMRPKEVLQDELQKHLDK